MKKMRLCAFLLCVVLFVALLPTTALAANGDQHTVTFDPGQGSGTMASQTATEGTPFSMPDCTFTPPSSDWEFYNWKISVGSFETYVEARDGVFFSSDATATANWGPAGGYIAPGTTPSVFGVSSSLTNLTSTNASQQYTYAGTPYPALGNSTYQATLTPATGYALPDTITVERLRRLSTSAATPTDFDHYVPPKVEETYVENTDYTYDETTGEIEIFNATLQDINIASANAPAEFSIRITAAGVSGTVVSTPTFSPVAGTYSNAQMVTLACATPGATIRYTTDGSEPTASSQPFHAGMHIPVVVTTTIRAKAFATGMTPSAVATATYTINTPPPATDIDFTSAIANGSATATTTKVTITLTPAVGGFDTGDITLTDTDGTGATVNALLSTGVANVYDLTLTGVTKGGSINIALSRTGLTFTPTNRDVTVWYYTPPSPPHTPSEPSEPYKPSEDCIITYHNNGGEGVMPPDYVTKGVPFALPGCTFTPPFGKEFKTWAIGSRDGTQVNAGETYTFTKSTTVYAIWEHPTLLSIPKTGDASSPAGYFMMVVAALAVSLIACRRKRRDG